MKDERLKNLTKQESSVLARIEAFVPMSGSACTACTYGRHNYKDIPAECTECTFKAERDMPYAVLVPAWKEGIVPSKKDANTASKLAAMLLSTDINKRADDWKNDPACDPNRR